MKKYIHEIILLLVILLSSLAGIAINKNGNAYANNCENLTCEYDLLGGFRCFDSGFDGYNCNDSQYPTCEEIACGGGQPLDPIEVGN